MTYRGSMSFIIISTSVAGALRHYALELIHISTILVPAGDQDPTVHLTQSVLMAVAPPILLANQIWAHLVKPWELSINPVLFWFLLHIIWRRMMTHHSLPSYFSDFENAAVSTQFFWRARRRFRTRATEILYLAQFLSHDIWQVNNLWFIIHFYNLPWGRANRNENPPMNLRSQQTVYQTRGELKKMLSTGWSWHLYIAKQEVMFTVMWKISLMIPLMLARGWQRIA